MRRTRGPLRIMACESGRPFAEKVYAHLKRHIKNGEKRGFLQFIPSTETVFANKEMKTEIEDSIRGTDVFVFQDVANSVAGNSVNDKVMALITAIDAVRRSEANHITAVIPCFPYARQDKPFGREPMTAVDVARDIEDAGAHSVLTLDIHNPAIAGFFRKAILENLHASKNIIGFVEKHINTKKLVVSSADENAELARHYAERMRTELVICYKWRDYSKPNEVKEIRVNGNVAGKDILVVDDMIDTAGTIVKVVEVLKKEGAMNIFLACSLPIFSGRGISRLTELAKGRLIQLVIGTNAIFHGYDFRDKCPWFYGVPVDSYHAKVINNLNHYKSISELLR